MGVASILFFLVCQATKRQALNDVAGRGLEAPMLQSFLNYLLLLGVYGGLVAFDHLRGRSLQGGNESGGVAAWKPDWKSVSAFLLFALADIEA